MLLRHHCILAILLLTGATTAMAGATNITSADGIGIHAESAGKKGDPVIVLVHGWSCDSTYWQTQISDLATNYRVITIDLAAHGQSAAGRQTYTMEAFALDVVAVLKQWDIRDAILVGHSMGGAVIVEAALAAPDRIRGLIGVDNFQKLNMTLTDEQINGFLGAFQQDFPAFTAQWVQSMFPENANGDLVALIAKDMASAPAEPALNAMNELLHWSSSLASAQMEKLAVPLMCINSDKTPTAEAEMLAVVPLYQARYLNGTGHFLFRENPVAFNQLLRETIAEFDANTGAETSHRQ